MKVLLAGINAKYIHSNLGIYSLRAYAREALKDKAPLIELGEYTINHSRETILQDIYKRKPDFIGFSCYIWNISLVKSLIGDLKILLPGTALWLGGPEVSYDGIRFLEQHPGVSGIMKGEGEAVFSRLLDALSRDEGPGGIPGLVYRQGERIIDTGEAEPLDISRLPFPYAGMDPGELSHRILYYESSRGCPFRCSYCLSSIDRRVRLRDMDLVKRELAWFLEAGVPQVKFVDRTFNCSRGRALEIWQFIKENDRGQTNFHFEIGADLLGEEEISLLASMRPGLVQLEIGVQSANPRTLEAIGRKTDIGKIHSVTSRIEASRRVHQHLDLIAGLPWEDKESFRESFNRVYAMKPDQLQLGFLKVLKGTPMEADAARWGIRHSSVPPYEVLSTPWLPYDAILELKGVEDMVEVYYNSRQFTHTLALLEKICGEPWDMFLALSRYYAENGLADVSHSRMARYDILWAMIQEKMAAAEAAGERTGREPGREELRDALVRDFYLRENAKSRPAFARDMHFYKEEIREFFRREEKERRYLKGYEGYDARQMERMTHVEALKDGGLLLFDYRERDPLDCNARCILLPAAGRDRGVNAPDSEKKDTGEKR